MPGTSEIIVICVVIVLLFGASSIPKLARNIGKAKGEFEKGIREGNEDAKKDEEKKSKNDEK